MKKSLGFTIFTALLATGCVGLGEMLPGKLYALEQGRVLAFEIEVTRGSGKVRAVDPVTKEEYGGTYIGVLESINVDSTSTSFGRAGVVTSNSFGVAQSNMANASAVLIGNQGSVLDCEMKIQAGIRPRGFGTCVDKKGGKYRLQF